MPDTDESMRMRQALGVPLGAGNAAAAAVMAPAQTTVKPLGAPRSATMTLGSWLAKSQPTDQYRVQIKTTLSDVVGHAWITVAQVGDPSRTLSAGFYPNSLWSGVYGPGQLSTPEVHEGDEDHVETAVVDQAHFRAMLDVVNEYETANYGLLINNCTDFARKAWQAATERDVYFDSYVIWSPTMLGMVIGQDNKDRGLDEMEHPKQPAK
jgi:hypothetical protein